jgi:hypothetical protein
LQLLKTSRLILFLLLPNHFWQLWWSIWQDCHIINSNDVRFIKSFKLEGIKPISRSYHTTRRKLKELVKSNFSDQNKKAKTFDKLKDELSTKRRVKKLVKNERRQSGKPLSPASIDSIPIRISDSSPYVHYPAGPDDLRELLRRLPASLTDGLKAVEFCLGKESQEITEEEWAAPERDPYTSRLGYESFTGVYHGDCLGVYYPNCGLIHLFAWVYDPKIPYRRIIEFYLRLRMLMTFVHELGHHFDNTSRVARGRWRSDKKEKDEIYAENVEHNWAQEFVVPYLEQKYSGELSEFNSWIKERAGVSIPLKLIAGDPRSTGPGGTILTSSLFSVSGALVDFVSAVIKNENPITTRIEFARDIHYFGEYEFPLAILKTVLDMDPANIEAIVLEGDIFIHQEKFDLARQRAETALQLEPENIDALEVLADAFEGLKQWETLDKIANRLMEYYKNKKEKYGYWSMLIQRARARIGQGDYIGGRADLDDAAKRRENKKRKRKPGLPKGQLEPIIEDINKQLLQEMSESQRKAAEQLRDDIVRQINQAGKREFHIPWPPEQ